MDRVEPAPRITLEAFARLCEAELPFLRAFGFVVEAIGHGTARAHMPDTGAMLRPGGTISGPAQMALADFVMYAAVLGAVGDVPLAVTTQLSINFLQRPKGELTADCRLLKLGKRLAVGEVSLFDATGALVSHVTATYSIPPDRKET
jgi:uncharacterized protein (TIGR00369 family)